MEINAVDPGDVPALLADFCAKVSNGGLPSSSAHVIHRTQSLLNRLGLPKLLLRVRQYPNLRVGNVREAVNARGGGLVFTTAGGLSDVVGLFDIYVGPLLGRLTPHLWNFQSIRLSGVSILLLAGLQRGLPPEPRNLIDTPPAEGSEHQKPPDFDTGAGRAALIWWCRPGVDLRPRGQGGWGRRCKESSWLPSWD